MPDVTLGDEPRTRPAAVKGRRGGADRSDVEDISVDAPRDHDDRATRQPTTPVLVALRLVMAALLLVAVPAHLGLSLLWGDSARFGEIATADGRAYRDHPVEYPPLTLAVIHAVAAGHDADEAGVARGVVVVALTADLVSAFVLGRAFGGRARHRYLLLGTPLVVLGLAYCRLDLLSVALAAAGLAACKRGRSTAGGLAFVAGAFAKLWPAALLGVLVVQRRWRALGTSHAVGGAGLAAWVAYGGTAGPRQVLTMRGARGWQIESLPGSIVRILSNRPAFEDAGAWRVGSAPAMARLALTAAALAVIVAAWRRAARRGDAFGATPLLAVTALLVTAPLLSPQFLLWLLPGAALVAGGAERPLGERVQGMAMVAFGLTAVMAGVLPSILVGEPAALLLVLLRNVALVVLLRSAWAVTVDPMPADGPIPATEVSATRPAEADEAPAVGQAA
jgi:hypothetical protein